jgi:hypothetical protein
MGRENDVERQKVGAQKHMGVMEKGKQKLLEPLWGRENRLESFQKMAV